LRFAGKLHTWNDERGFGFIRPLEGGDDVFVHVSSLPGGTRPSQDAALTFEVALDRAGRKKAIHVRLQQQEAAALAADRLRGRQESRPEPLRAGRDRHRSTGVRMGVLALVGLCAFSWYAYTQQRARSTAQGARNVPASVSAPAHAAPAPTFSCDGRRYCSEMRSCAEAQFFLKNCPGTEMDGDRDGIPCEQQWCTGR
jgi:cold shock CspA family protein